MFGSGVAIYQIKTAPENVTLLPYVDDEKCVQKQLERIAGLDGKNTSAQDANDGVDINATFRDGFNFFAQKKYDWKISLNISLLTFKGKF